jgi:hypothetical protein
VAQAGRRWCRWDKEGGNRFPHQGPIRGRACYPHHGSDGTVPWRRQRRPGSRRDGPEACSPGEVREVTRSLDGRGMGRPRTSGTTRVSHHPSRAPRARPWDRRTRRGCPVTLGLGADGEGRIGGARSPGGWTRSPEPPRRLTGRPRGPSPPQHFRGTARAGAPSQRGSRARRKSCTDQNRPPGRD